MISDLRPINLTAIITMYEYEIQIGMSHAGSDNRLKLGIAIDLLQNGSFFQMDTEETLMDYMEENKTGMYLVARQLTVSRLPVYGETVRIRSWISGVSRLFGIRNTIMVDAGNRLCLSSEETGAFIQLATGLPLRIPKELANSIVCEPALPSVSATRKIPIPDQRTRSEDYILIKDYHLDHYGHMNNARYAELAHSALPKDFHWNQLRTEYKTAAREGDVLHTETASPIPGQILVVLYNQKEEACAVFLFL